MRLLEDLERLLAEEQSPFRAQLLREDVARLRKLQELAASASDIEASSSRRTSSIAGTRCTARAWSAC